MTRAWLRMMPIKLAVVVFETTAISSYLQSYPSEFEYTINYPDENIILNHTILKPYLEQYGVHWGNVTDCCPDASVPFDSCVSCSTPSTTNHDHTCEWGGFQRHIQVLTAQPTSLGHRVFNQIRLLSAT